MREDRQFFDKEIEPFDDIGGEDEFRIPLKTAIDQLQRALERVPEPYRDSAVFRVWGGGESVFPEVRYTEPETDDAMAARHAKDRRLAEIRAEAAEATERAFYERLRQKYALEK